MEQQQWLTEFIGTSEEPRILIFMMSQEIYYLNSMNTWDFVNMNWIKAQYIRLHHEALGRPPTRSQTGMFLHEIITLARVHDDRRGRTWEWNRIPSSAIPFEEGWLNIQNREFSYYSPDEYVRFTIPVKYLQPFKWPTRFLQFINEVFAGDEYHEARVETLCALLLNTFLFRENHRYIAWQLGEGTAGKSVVTNWLSNLFGEAVIEFDLLEKDWGYKLGLLGRSHLIIIPETTDCPIGVHASEIKAISGKDRMQVRPIYGKPRKVTPEARIWLNSNTLPEFTPSERKAFGSRIIPLLYPNTFEDKEDTRLLEKLEAETHGFLILLSHFQEYRAQIKEYREQFNSTDGFSNEAITTNRFDRILQDIRISKKSWLDCTAIAEKHKVSTRRLVSKITESLGKLAELTSQDPEFNLEYWKWEGQMCGWARLKREIKLKRKKVDGIKHTGFKGLTITKVSPDR